MIKKVYIYKVNTFVTYSGLIEFLNKNDIFPDRIISILNDKEYVILIYYVKEFREYRKDGSYEKIC